MRVIIYTRVWVCSPLQVLQVSVFSPIGKIYFLNRLIFASVTQTTGGGQFILNNLFGSKRR